MTASWRRCRPDRTLCTQPVFWVLDGIRVVQNRPSCGGRGVPWYIVNLTDASNVQIACLEITDHSNCIEDHLFPTGGSKYTCHRDEPPYGDWAAIGLYAEDSSNVLLKDLDIHGLANTGIQAGRLTDWTVENVRLVGNGLAGWNGDLVGDGTESENHGTLTFRHWAGGVERMR